MPSVARSTARRRAAAVDVRSLEARVAAGMEMRPRTRLLPPAVAVVATPTMEVGVEYRIPVVVDQTAPGEAVEPGVFPVDRLAAPEAVGAVADRLDPLVASIAAA